MFEKRDLIAENASLTAERDALDVLAQERLKSVEQARAERNALKGKLELLNSFYASNAEEEENEKLSEATRRMVSAESALREARGALEALPLDNFSDDMSKHDAADFVDNAGAFFEAMVKARVALKAEDVPPQEGESK